MSPRPMGFNAVLGSCAIIALLWLVDYGTCMAMAGEETPVFEAWCLQRDGNCKDRENRPVKYQRNLKAVKRSVTYLNSDKFESLKPRQRSSRSVEDDVEPDSYAYLPLQDTEDEMEFSASHNETRVKRTQFYGNAPVTNLLVVMQYEMRSGDSGKWTNNLILYALAYWRRYNMKLRGRIERKNFKRSAVKIVGIVVCLHRQSTPYLSDGPALDSLRASNRYWSTLPPELEGSPHHVVAVMTDIKPYYENVGGFEVALPDREGGFGGTFIVWDDMDFAAVTEHTSMAAFQTISNTLNYRAQGPDKVIPKNMKPGKDVQDILPGKLFSAEQQCFAQRFYYLDHVCKDMGSDCEIYCKNTGFLKSCTSIGRAWEGTPCVNGKIV